MKNSQKGLMKVIILVGVLLIIAVTGYYFSLQGNKSNSVNNPPVVCSQEAMQCPDGSYVGRTGSHCEFAQCPTPVATSTPQSSGSLQGTMTIGPICPVEQVGHPCNPTPQMYAAHKVFVYTSNKSKTIATLTPDTQGHFSALLPVGDYIVDVEHSAVGAVQGVPTTIKIVSNKTYTITISIDTGIR